VRAFLSCSPIESVIELHCNQKKDFEAGISLQNPIYSA
jgi:hypothetical protein